MSEAKQAETPHPVTQAEEALVRSWEARDAAQASQSPTLYRQALQLVDRRARQYGRAMEGLLEELGE